jgi:tetratricopeptide (TPR) repeat protein
LRISDYRSGIPKNRSNHRFANPVSNRGEFAQAEADAFAKTIETAMQGVHNGRPLVRFLRLSFFLLLYASNPLLSADKQLSQLRAQLKAAKGAADNPAMIELSRRIVAITPGDSDVWETLAQTELETEDLDRLEQTLGAWQKAVRHPPAAIEDFQGTLCFKRRDYQCAERHWLAYIATKPPASDIADEYDSLADLCAAQARWEDHAAYRTKAIAAKDSAARRVARAVASLRLRKWDAAYADMTKANQMDATDSQVKEWLPQFERLQLYLPSINALDAEIAKSPNNFELLLQRARLFTIAGRPLLALDDAERAFKLQPASMRARIQTGEALLDTGRGEDAAKLQVGRLARDREDGHVSEQALLELSVNDALLAQNPKNLEALVARAGVLRWLQQLTLALADAQAVIAVNEKSADAHFLAAHLFDDLGQQKNALTHARIATELNPNDPAKWSFRGVLERQRADFEAAIQSQTRSLQISESLLALSEREQCERRVGKISEADADLRRMRELGP